MEGLLKSETQGMNQETTRYFIEGLKIAIKRSGLNQTEFAEGVTSKTNLSNILRGKVGTSETMRSAIAKKLNMDIAEIVLIGKRAEGGGEAHQPAPYPKQPQASQTGRIDPMDVVDAVNALARKYHQCEDDLRLWRLVFDMLPVAAIIIKDGVIHFQNQRSRVWGHETGTPIAESCVNVDCEKSGDCPVRRSIENMMPTTGSQRIGGVLYKIKTIPIPINDHGFLVVLAFEDDN